MRQTPGVELEALAPAFLEVFRGTPLGLDGASSAADLEFVGAFCDSLVEFAERAFPSKVGHFRTS